MLLLLGLKPLSKAKCLLNAPLIGARNGVEGSSKDRVVVGIYFCQRQHSFVDFSLDDFIIGKLFSKDSHLSLQRTHFFFAVSF